MSTDERTGDLNRTGGSVIRKLQSMFSRLSKWSTIFRFSMENLETRLGRKVPRLKISWSLFVLGTAISIYTIVFSYLTILRHGYFQSSAWDLGIYMQSLYTTSYHGQILGYTLERFAENPSGTFFGVHFSPFLLVLVPLYRLAPFAETLLILQSFVIALGAFGLYLLSYQVHSNRFISLSLAVAYLLYTPMYALNWFDFHLQAFIPIFFFLMFYFYIRHEYLKSLTFLLLTLSTIEIMPLLLFPFGLYCVLRDRKDRRALIYAMTVMCVSVLWFLVASFVKSSLNPMYATTFGPWSMWGTNSLQILTSMITRPVDVVFYFFTVFPLEKALYFLWFMAPLLFLPIFARKECILLVMPWMTLVFLSDYLGYYTNQYAAFIVPQIFIAAIYGLKQVSKSIGDEAPQKIIKMRYATWILWAAIIVVILVSPYGLIPQAREIYIHGLPQDTLHKEALRDALQMIPSSASVYTSFHIAPHLANRLELYAHAIPDKPPDYIFIDLRSPDTSISLGSFGGPAIVGMDQLLEKYNYSSIFSNDGILIYQASLTNSSSTLPITMPFNYEDLTLDFGKIVDDTSSRSGRVLIHEPSDWSNGFWHGPYVALPRGTYEVTYKLKSLDVPDEQLLTLDVTSESGSTEIAKKYVYGHDLTPNAWSNITIRFVVDQAQLSVEFRGTYASNLTTEYLDNIEVRRISPVSNIAFGTHSFKHDDLTFVRGKQASGGLIIHERNDTEAFSFGLSKNLPPGTYEARFWLRLDSFSQGSVFSATISDFNETTLAEMQISAEDFDQIGSFQRFSIDFVMSNCTSVVEIRGIGNVNASTSFSYLELENIA